MNRDVWSAVVINVKAATASLRTLNAKYVTDTVPYIFPDSHGLVDLRPQVPLLKICGQYSRFKLSACCLKKKSRFHEVPINCPALLLYVSPEV